MTTASLIKVAPCTYAYIRENGYIEIHNARTEKMRQSIIEEINAGETIDPAFRNTAAETIINGSNDTTPATEAQKKYLTDLTQTAELPAGYIDGLTKAEASAAITIVKDLGGVETLLTFINFQAPTAEEEAQIDEALATVAATESAGRHEVKIAGQEAILRIHPDGEVNITFPATRGWVSYTAETPAYEVRERIRAGLRGLLGE